MKDAINPDHYKRSDIETIDAIEAMVAGWPPETAYRLGNVLKYLWRHQEKGGVESLQKAAWYLQREIESQSLREPAGTTKQPEKRAAISGQSLTPRKRRTSGLLF